jgi:cell division septum initiation protein DivIVA
VQFKEKLSHSYERLKRDNQELLEDNKHQRDTVAKLREENEKLRDDIVKLTQQASTSNDADAEYERLMEMVRKSNARCTDMEASLMEYQRLLDNAREESARLRENCMCSATRCDLASSYTDSVFLDEEVASAVASRRGSVSSVAGSMLFTETNNMSDLEASTEAATSLFNAGLPPAVTSPNLNAQPVGLRTSRSMEFPPAPVQAIPGRSPDLRPIRMSHTNSVGGYSSRYADDDEDAVYFGRHHRQHMRARRANASGLRRWTDTTSSVPLLRVTGAEDVVCSRCRNTMFFTSSTTKSANDINTVTIPESSKRPVCVDVGVQTDAVPSRHGSPRPNILPLTLTSRHRYSSYTETDEDFSSYDEYEYYGDEDGESDVGERSSAANVASSSAPTTNTTTVTANVIIDTGGGISRTKREVSWWEMWM